MTTSLSFSQTFARRRGCVLLIALCIAVPPLPRAYAAALPIPAGLVVEQDDRNAILSWDLDALDPVVPLPAGVAGYQITWGPASQPEAFRKLTEERIIQLQPLVNGQPYVARVRSVDSAGQLSAASAPISFTGSALRVDALRARMNGFFDDFNLPQGLPDELKWNSAYSRCNADWSNGFFINDQFHAHNTVFSGNCDRAQSISRPRAVLDFSDNATRTIVFDFDGEFRRNQWYLDLVPRLMDISGQVSLEGISVPADPADGLRFHQNEQALSIGAFGADGAQDVLASTDWKPYPPLDWAGSKLVSNVRRHWELHISRDHAEIWVNGKLVLATTPGAFHLAQQHYYLLWNTFGYNTAKANEPLVLVHWDNFGFDAPAGTTNDTVTHNYRLVNSGSDFMRTSGAQATTQTTLRIPDPVAGARARRLMFTLQMNGNDAYAWSPSDSVSVNGTTFAIPKPVSNAQPALPPEALVSSIVPYSLVIELPDGVLRQGANQISFATQASSVLNIHAELDFNAASAPAFTQPTQAIGGAQLPSMPAIGPNAAITQIGDTKVATYEDNLRDQAHFNPEVRGVVPISIAVHNEIALHGAGNNTGVRQVELLVDGRVVLVQRTDAQSAAPAVLTTLSLDTRSLTDGVHELYLRAYSPLCVPSIADYGGAGSAAGAYFALHITVRNGKSISAAAARLPNAVWLPMQTVGTVVPATCAIIAASAAAQPSQAPIAASFGFARPAAVRDEQRMICDI